MMYSLPERNSRRNFNFTPTKPPKQQRIREYIVYCCPTGRFLTELETFWDKSKDICGFNGPSHFTIPHITLVSFFKAHDESEINLSQSLRYLVEDGKYLNRPLSLELYSSANFIGYFVNGDDANILKRIALKFVKEISNSIISDTFDNFDALVTCFPWCSMISGSSSGVNENSRCIPKSSRSISLEPHVKSLHMTLAYQFPQEKFQSLVDLVEKIDTSFASSWELRLYSRDPRLATKHVHKVMYPHTSREVDELELRIGDYVYINSDAALNSVDGWVEGISFQTQNVGFLPINYTDRTSESHVWSLNESVTLCNESIVAADVDSVDGTFTANRFNDDNLSCETNFVSQTMAEDRESSTIIRKKRAIILRHGERVDFTFGSEWIENCFNEHNNYTRMDLNMPERLPDRERVPADWTNDSPLTVVGLFQARQLGTSLKNFGVKFSKVFVSPAFRCIQTATEVLRAMDSDLKLNIELGMFEWLAWYENFGFPNWMTTKELLAAGYNINKDYQPVMDRISEEHIRESLEEFYNRNSNTMQEILRTNSGDILVVGHATNLDTCTRQIVGKEPRTRNDIRVLLPKIPYLGCSAIQEVEGSSEVYELVDPPCLTFTHTSSNKFDWNILDDN